MSQKKVRSDFIETNRKYGRSSYHRSQITPALVDHPLNNHQHRATDLSFDKSAFINFQHMFALIELLINFDRENHFLRSLGSQHFHLY